MFRRLPTIFLALLIICPVTADEATGRLEIETDVPRLDLESIPGGSRNLQLPRLDYAFRIRPECPRGFSIASVSIGIADTQHVFSDEEYAQHGVLEAILSVPSGQIAPLPVGDFCSAKNESKPVLRIPGALTGHALLYCRNSSENHVVYDSLSLGIELRCASSARRDSSPSIR